VSYWSPTLERTLIPTLGGSVNYFSDINDSGQVAGSSKIGSTDLSGLYLWSLADGLADLGAFPGGQYITAADINNRGEIVGVGDYPGRGFGNAGFLWTPEKGLVPLAVPQGGIELNPIRINEQGQIVGDYARGTDEYDVRYHAFIQSATGVFQELGFPGEYWSAAMGINGRGEVGGTFSMAGDGHVHPFFWSPEAGWWTSVSWWKGIASR